MIDPTQISRALHESIGASVISSQLIPQGESSWTYKVTTNVGVVSLRVPKSLRPRIVEKFQWIDKVLAEHGIPQARLLFATEEYTIFPYGYMVFEFIESLDRHDALVTGAISFEDFHKELGQLMKRVHAISVPQFGPIPPAPDRTNNDFIEHNIVDAARVLGEAETWEESFPKGLIIPVQAAIAILEPVRVKLKPALCHTDPAPDNCLWNKDMGVVLIDWEGALGTSWVVDLADMTYSGSHLSELGPREERRKRILASFLEGHGLGEFTYEELLHVEHVLHIIKAVHHLPYYYQVQKNYEWFWKTKDRLLELLAIR